MNRVSNLKSLLNKAIENVASNLARFTRNPGRDFSRKSKLSFIATVRLILSLGGGTLSSELLDYFKYDSGVVTSSAFVQQRGKILPDAFESLFREFTGFLLVKKLGNYRLLAVDGSDINIPQNPADKAAFFKRKADSKGCNLLHLNALYDLISGLYVDYNVQPKRESDENRALVDMIDKSNVKGRVIVIGDRGYESYNNIAHVAGKGWKFLFRVKLGGNGILRTLALPNGACDVDVNLRFTRSYKRAKSNPGLKHISNNMVFDYIMPDSDDEYGVSFRAVRFQLPNGDFEAVVTNLNRDEFPPPRLMELYHMRWGLKRRSAT